MAVEPDGIVDMFRPVHAEPDADPVLEEQLGPPAIE